MMVHPRSISPLSIFARFYIPIKSRCIVRSNINYDVSFKVLGQLPCLYFVDVWAWVVHDVILVSVIICPSVVEN